MEIPIVLKRLGFDERQIRVYLALLSGGTATPRKLSKDTELSRSAVFDAIRTLKGMGLVGEFQKHKKLYFMPEDPEKLKDVVERHEQGIAELRRRVNEMLPELRMLCRHGNNRPAVKYYEGMKGVDIVLRDIIAVMTDLGDERLYRTFTSSRLQHFIYGNFSNFAKESIERDIRARSLVIGDSSEVRPLAEQRSIPAKEAISTSIYVYGSKVAHISLDDDDFPICILIEDARIAQIQRVIFDNVWNAIKEKRRVAFAATIDEHL